jgi:CheY-specific phosphatase CheX
VVEKSECRCDMNDNLKQQIFDTLADVFGIMFYIPIKPLAGEPPREMWSSGINYIEAMIGINCGNDQSFQTMFFFPEELAKNIAINFMAVEEEALNEEKIIDAVKEATNMSIGGLLGKIDPEAKCRIGIPSASLCEGFSPGSLLGEPGACVYDTEYGYLWIDLGEIEQLG